MNSIACRAGILTVAWIASIVALGIHGYCEDTPGQMDKHSEEALSRTQELLKDPKKRENPEVKTEQTDWINNHVKSLAGSKENTQAIFELSADIFGMIAREANGDPVKMMTILEGYKKNPQSLDKKLTPEQRQRLKEITSKIETNSTKTAKP